VVQKVVQNFLYYSEGKTTKVISAQVAGDQYVNIIPENKLSIAFTWSNFGRPPGPLLFDT
jgi:hypothetical protein